MSIGLRDYQLEAVHQMKNGCILCGGVGSGKSRTALSYFYLQQGGTEEFLTDGCFEPMDDINISDLYIITTARKRDTLEWEGELTAFLMTTDNDNKTYNHKVVVDSWNNIQKYADVKNAFFIFDEQRVVGSGAWAKAFLKITKTNRWVLLSATPGDTWMDYIPVFVANGFYKNRTEFIREHVIYRWGTKYPQVDRFVNTRKLERLKNEIIIYMDFERPTVPHHEELYLDYDKALYRQIMRERWNPWEDRPIKDASELYYAFRKVVNTDESRCVALLELMEDHPKVIIFYNFDYELEILKALGYPKGTEIAEWNGHKHQAVPLGKRWVYLVQYAAGSEAWNCITTDTIVFYSQNYSYKVMAQAAGRIDRMNTPFTDLYYYHFKSRSYIDLAISRALAKKQNFNTRREFRQYNITFATECAA